MIRKLLPLLLCLAMLLTAPLTVLAEEKEEGLVLSTAEEFLAFAGSRTRAAMCAYSHR